MEFVNSYRQLEVYKLSRNLAKEIFDLSSKYPKGEMYSLTDQMRRSSRSIGAQIAEAWGKRLYLKHFISKLTDADAEQHETQHWIEVSEDCGYISHDETSALISKCGSIGKMLQSMIDKAPSFCRSPIASKKQLPNTEY